MRENLWAHMLGPLNVPIQSEALSEEPQYRLLIGSVRSISFLFTLCSFASEKTSGFQGNKAFEKGWDMLFSFHEGQCLSFFPLLRFSYVFILLVSVHPTRLIQRFFGCVLKYFS